MAPITDEGQRDFEEIAHSMSKGDLGSAYCVLSKYSLQSTEDMINTISRMVVHPTALALRRHDKVNEIRKAYEGVVLFMHNIVCDFLSVEIIRLTMKLGKMFFLGRSKERYWNESVYTCILCKGVISQSNKDLFAWKKCDECKGYVCPKCDCQKYHLSHQSKLWEDYTETIQDKDTKKLAKQRKRKQKKRKIREILAPIDANSVTQVGEASSQCVSVTDTNTKSNQDNTPMATRTTPNSIQTARERVDFVQYLQDTNSLITLDNLMDDLESKGYEFDGHPFCVDEENTATISC